MWLLLLALVLPTTATRAISGRGLPHGALALRLDVPETVRDAHNITIVTTVLNTGKNTLTIVNDPEGLLSPYAKPVFELYEQSIIEPSVLVRSCSEYSSYLDQPEDEWFSLQDYIILEPGEHRSVAHNISGLYAFRHAGPHIVWVSADAQWFRIVENNCVLTLAKAKMINDPTAGKAAIINIDKSVIYSSPDGTNIPISGGSSLHAEKDESVSHTPSIPKFTRCSPEQQTIITTAISSATPFIHELNAAISKLDSLRSTKDERPSGSPDDMFWDTYKRCYSSSQRRLNEFQYNCDCGECLMDTFARSNKYGVVNLCAGFWRVPYARFDDRAGVLVDVATKSCSTR